MQGIVRDDKGAYVKSAIVRLLKINDAIGESDEEAVTYAETDKDGKFVIRDLDPEGRYMIEIHIEIPEPAVDCIEVEPLYMAKTEDESEPEDESELEDELEPEDGTDRDRKQEFAGGIIDSINFGSTADETIKVNLSVNSLYNIGFDPKDKPYLTKNNTW